MNNNQDEVKNTDVMKVGAGIAGIGCLLTIFIPIIAFILILLIF